MKKRQNHTDIKIFFEDYLKLRGRHKHLRKLSLYRELREEEAEEYEVIGKEIELVNQILNTLESTQRQIIVSYYIEKKSLFDISLDLNYCYEHVSWVKNLGCDILRSIFTGVGLSDSKYTKLLIDLIKQQKA